jgi:Na+/phosphate symporter
MFNYISNVLLQVPLELQKASETGPVAGVLVGVIILLVPALAYVFNLYRLSQKEIKEIQLEHAKEIAKQQEDRNKQWLESEKETLNVLNGVSSILEMSEKMGQNDTNKILEKIKSTEERLLQRIDELKKG